VESLEKGNGKTFPRIGDRVECHYEAMFASSGKKFDSSTDRKFDLRGDKGAPLEFVVGRAPCTGWNEGILELSIGELARLSITSDLAFGDKDFTVGRQTIPANSDVIFEVRLVTINGKSRNNLDEFEVRLDQWVAEKLATYSTDTALQTKYPTQEKYEKHLQKQVKKKLCHVDV